MHCTPVQAKAQRSHQSFAPSEPDRACIEKGRRKWKTDYDRFEYGKAIHS